VATSGDERVPGRATAQGTRRFAERFADLPGHFRAPDGIALASLGMGTRGGEPGGGDDFAYRSAVPRALEVGINVFDTALSYRAQRSERTLGAALRRAFAEKRVARDEVFVITKGGYLTVDPDLVRRPQEARRYLVATYVESGLVDPDGLADGIHSLDPRFLEDQIERSRRNLGLATLDLYCLEDPELHLLAKGPSAFRKLLAEAFAVLEDAVRAGAIGAYGLSTWTGFLVPYTERGHLAIAEVLELALEVGGADHHLRGLALPYSVGMGEALGLPSQFAPGGGPSSVLDAVRDTGTAVFACAPLVRGRAVRGLPPFLRDAFPSLRTDAQRSLQFVRSTPGITTALVGLRDLAHVDQAGDLARHAPAPPEVIASLFESAKRGAE
jgi:aryl-alcohol dehydrogenase-like predicted oxidoreductase